MTLGELCEMMYDREPSTERSARMLTEDQLTDLLADWLGEFDGDRDGDLVLVDGYVNVREIARDILAEMAEA